MNCKNVLFIYIYHISNHNSTMQQNDTKVMDNYNLKNQDSIIHTMQKYNTNDVGINSKYNSHIPKKKGKEKCVIY